MATYAVAALTLLALVVRIPGLDGGLWIDEIVSVVRSFRTPFPQSLAEFDGDNKHPLYSLLAHFAVSVLGEHAWTVRLPAMLAGVASVPLLYALGVRAATKAEGFAAAALLALSYHHVWFSQNARGYSMLAMWAIAGTIALLRAMRDGGIRWWILFGIISAMGVYTHLTFAFVVMGQGLVVVLSLLGLDRAETRPHWRNATAGFLVAGVGALLMYAPMLGRVVVFFSEHQSALRGVSTPGWAMAEGLRVLKTGFGAAGIGGSVVLVAGAVVGITGLASYWRNGRRALLLMVVPGLATLGGSLAAGRTIYPRFFLAFIGFALLILMRGAFALAAHLAKRAGLSASAGRRAGAAIAGALVAVSAVSVPLVWQAPKQDFGGAMRFADASVGVGEIVATADVTSLVYGPYYRRDWRAVRNGAELDTLRSTGSVWLVFTFPRYLRNFDPALGAVAERECTDAPRFRGTLGGGDVIVCRLERK